MFDWLRRRRLSSESRRKLLIVAARAEEAIVETHVSNVMELMRALGDEIDDVDRGIELYVEMIPMDAHVAATVTNRVLARYDAASGGDRLRSGGGGDAGRFANVFRDGDKGRR